MPAIISTDTAVLPIGKPTTKSVIIPDTGHLQIEESPEKIIELIEKA